MWSQGSRITNPGDGGDDGGRCFAKLIIIIAFCFLTKALYTGSCWMAQINGGLCSALGKVSMMIKASFGYRPSPGFSFSMMYQFTFSSLFHGRPFAQFLVGAVLIKVK